MHPTLSTLKALITSQPFKRSQLGLFQGKTKQYGNNVPFSKHKTRRTWLPNVQRKRLFSDTLQRFVRVKLTTRALRTIKKKYASIDNYLFRNSASTVSHEGLRLRLMMRDAVATRPTAGETQRQFENRKADEVRRVQTKQALRDRKVEVNRAVSAKGPTLEDARKARLAAVEALRGTTSSSEAIKPGQVLLYLKQQQKEQKRLLGQKFFSVL
ncbi:hypothetical protein D9758_003120 [Tetrapyrgos nigripes]|uniref:Large ribosomal subunit protein bL28c n=1 Tax=Tetrapyrgos nigripes TaxID=182062 RepID=A0A8H5FWQ6_9AGAR|nr:hypothetical protein D9758_007162 [Tetrapyrgos nigripes]KAF5368834.1 hypothetical protein D9758_003120 [Tetrapyrgos nigripes]